MRENLYSASGFYSPNYLRMKVNTDDSFLSYENLSDIGAATFFHEYVHFLQDITTTHGLFNICSEVDFIKLFNSKLQKEGVSSIEVPFTSEEPDGNVHANLEMRKIWIGGGEHAAYTGDFIVGTEIQELHVSGQSWSMNRVYLQWGTETEGGPKYYFGSYCISESMAYEMERMVYPDVLPEPPQMPYKAARLLADKVYPTFSNNAENLVALCDASMMYNDPGLVFYNCLMQMEKIGYYPKEPENVYDYVFEEIKFEYQGINKPIELLYFAGHLANTQLSDYFGSNIFGANSIWIARTLSAAENLRTQMPSFVLDLVRCGDIRQSVIFKAVKRKLGTPAIVNNKDEMFFEHILNGYGFKVHPQYFWVFEEIKDLLTKDWNRKTNLCRLKDYCDRGCEERGEESFTDYRCHNEPWERSKDPNPKLCVFGATWKTWALQGKSLEQKTE